MSFKSHIIPICLPESGVNFQNQEAFVSGWGMTSNSKRNQGKLQSGRVEVVPNAECATRFETQNETIANSELCAVANSSSICLGDSGAPLVVRRNGRAVLIGLASSVDGDCEMPQQLGVYANVSTLMPWIRANTDRNEAELTATPFTGYYTA